MIPSTFVVPDGLDIERQGEENEIHCCAQPCVPERDLSHCRNVRPCFFIEVGGGPDGKDAEDHASDESA